MNTKQYEKISAPFREEKKHKNLIIINKALTATGYITYPLLLLYTLIYKRDFFFPCIFIPASGFILLTFIRKKINRARPYETLQIKPLIKKDTKGNSMPSRHVFSLTMIAVSWLVVCPIVGMILLLCSLCIAFIRVIGGVHYPSDVLVGMLCALLWGFLYLV